MSDFAMQLAVVAVYKLAVIGSGTFGMFLGYRLFHRGIDSKVESLDARGRGTRLALQAAPGTFFALFGASIVCIGVYRGMSTSHSYEGVPQLAKAGAHNDLPNFVASKSTDSVPDDATDSFPPIPQVGPGRPIATLPEPPHFGDEEPVNEEKGRIKEKSATSSYRDRERSRDREELR
jgi:hypothetical protein